MVGQCGRTVWNSMVEQCGMMWNGVERYGVTVWNSMVEECGTV